MANEIEMLGLLGERQLVRNKFAISNRSVIIWSEQPIFEQAVRRPRRGANSVDQPHLIRNIRTTFDRLLQALHDDQVVAQGYVTVFKDQNGARRSALRELG